MITEQAGFFDLSETHDLISKLAFVENLTIFAGAGISIDRGSPTWDQLVSDLLRAQLGTGESPELSDIAHLMRLSGPLLGASMIRSRFQEQNSGDEVLWNKIRDHLYQSWLNGGGLSASIAYLAVWRKLRHLNTTIVTTNYDDNIETSLRESLLPTAEASHISLVGFTKIRAEDIDHTTGVIPVIHLHGLIPHAARGNIQGPIVFSEIDISETANGWQRALLGELLEAAPAIFVGTSLRDQYIVDAISRSAVEARTYSVLVMQDAGYFGQTAESKVSMVNFTDRRYKHLGITPIYCDFFGQVSQLLLEIALPLRLDRDIYGPSQGEEMYHKRLRQWWIEWSLGQTGSLQESAQRSISTSLFDSGVQVSNLLNQRKSHVHPRVTPEDWKTELWVRKDPDSRTMALWGTSEGYILRTETVHTGSIIQGHDYAAVRALRARQPTLEPTHASSRWRQCLAVPIILDDTPWYDLPVGVVVMLFRHDQLSSRESNDVDASTSLLGKTGRELLNPKAPTAPG